MVRRSLEQNLAFLEQLRSSDPAKAGAELEKLLGHKSNFVVARATEVSAELGLDLFTEMEEAFARFLVNGVETDKTCRAKVAIVKALVEADRRSDIYLTGLKHVQMEPVWGDPPRQDTAVELRGLCADALVKFHHPDVVDLLAVLLADEERGARASAARSIGDTGRRDGVPLLRYKATIGDPESEVMTECFASLLRLGRDNVEFVEPFLANPATAESAALAFGEARLEGTEPVLIAAAERSFQKKVFYLALAMMRTKTAIDHLLSLIEGGDDGAIEALEIYRHDTALMARIREITSKRA
jgi:HEAT repeat protein